MQQQGRITVRGPFGDDKKDKLDALLKGHPFNTEVVYFLPTLGPTQSDMELECHICIASDF